MPTSFDKCVKEGGKVRTKVLKGGRYVHFCIKDGKSYMGEVKKRKAGEGSKVISALREAYKK